jgi:UDP-glucose 4-epimerase
MGSDIDADFFETPFDQRIEFAHTRDVGQAFANAVDADVKGKIFLIGGGEKCQLTWGEFINNMMEGLGIGHLPESAFKKVKKEEDYYYTDWMDTKESQALLHYQSRTFEDYLADLKRGMGFRRYLTKLAGGTARKRILSGSPYYRQ